MDNSSPVPQPNQPQVQQYSVPQPKSTKFPGVLVTFFCFLFLLTAGYLYFQNVELKRQITKFNSASLPTPTVIVQPIISPSGIPAALPSVAPTVDPTANWKIFKNTALGIEFRYPPKLENLIKSKYFTITYRQKTDIIAEYQKFQSSGGCPGPCGLLASDSEKLTEQFILLSQLNTFQNCSLTDAYKADVKKEFILFTGAIGNKIDISGLQSGTLCGLRFIESDGYDVSISNFYYKYGFMKNEKVFRLNASIFPLHAFDSIDTLLSSLGFNLTQGSCDAACTEKEGKYFESFNINNPEVKEVLSTYDQIVTSIKFTD